MISRQLVSGFLLALGLSGALMATATADPKLRARPFVFVGSAGECGGVAGSDIVTAAWLGGLGLADDGVTPTPPPVGARRDPHRGLLLNKNGPTPNCAAAGASILGFKPGTTISELGFDHRVGDHCGAGAPRFNVVTTAGFLYFVGGCSAGTHTPAPQDAQWERVRFSATDFFPANSGPPFVFGLTQVGSIEIIFDEGTDTPTTSDPTGVGLAVLDNIDINGELITEGHGEVPRADGKQRNGREDADD